jgi:formylglycine-generating enzyme required for sulfatase activity
MSSLVRDRRASQPPGRLPHASAFQTAPVVLGLLFVIAGVATAEEAHPAPLANPDAEAKTQAEMKPYAELIEHTDTTIEMAPIPGGEFLMGSPESEADRGDDEGPQHKVKVDSFWMGKYEITWDAYEVWMFDLDIQRRKIYRQAETERDKAAVEYQISQPTEPYTDMTFGMGKRGYPAICMTQFAAKTFCQWLSAKTGRYYRLPTEAEWEYACRAGTTTAYSFGDDPAKLDEYAWHYGNSSDKYHQVGRKKPNPWGLYDMHGNVNEWVLDQYTTDFYGKFGDKTADNPLAIPTTLYPRVVRGGSWDSDPEECRSAARLKSDPNWKRQDPQIPRSIWYHTDATFVGFRIVRPLVTPSAEERASKWDKSLPEIDRKSGR